METIVLAIFWVFVIVGLIGIFIGLDPKKWASWLYGVYGFVSGVLIGFLRDDVSAGLKLGPLFAVSVMWGGVTTHWQKQRVKK